MRDGNAAIPAARAGASVTGLDLTPAMLEAARARGKAAGVTVEWVEGDAEHLPFNDSGGTRVVLPAQYLVAAGRKDR